MRFLPLILIPGILKRAYPPRKWWDPRVRLALSMAQLRLPQTNNAEQKTSCVADKAVILV